MALVPPNVNFSDSAASSAAKARNVIPLTPTANNLDVAVALKCITSFQLQGTETGMTLMDEEEHAAPLIAAARTLVSTAEHLELSGSEDADAINELRLYAALAHAMYGNFPSAKAAAVNIPDSFFFTSAMRWVAQLVISPDRQFHESSIIDMSLVSSFRNHWYWALRTVDTNHRKYLFSSALDLFGEVASSAAMSSDRALALSLEVALEQARRLSVISLIESAPEIPSWFVTATIAAGTLTLLPPQYQLLVRERIASRQGNSLLTLPTSTGKTLVAEACMVASNNVDGFSVYVAPYVAIGEQVRTSLKRKAEPHVPVISMFGGFRREIVTGQDRALMVMTPERFDAWLRSSQSQLHMLRLVVFDEIHIIENDVRGARIEGIISRLRLLQRRLPHLQILGLSAVLVMPELICQWMGVPFTNLFRIAWRPTARRLAICSSRGDIYWLHGNDVLRPSHQAPDAAISLPERIPIPIYVGQHRNPSVYEEDAAINVASVAENLRARLGQPGLIVCPRKADTRMLAAALEADLTTVLDPELAQVSQQISARYPWLGGLAACLLKGVAFHNASVPFDVRREIERLTRARKLAIVCSTSTLAEGADLPFRWTLISHWLGPDGLPMKSMTFRNIAGRSGRAGAFTEGDTILFENNGGPSEAYRGVNVRQRVTSVMFSSAPISSALGDGFGLLTGDKQQAVASVVGAQLLAAIAENPLQENLGSAFSTSTYASVNQFNNYINDIVNFSISQLLDGSRPGGALATMNSPIVLTPLGQAANQTGFSPNSVHQFVSYLSRFQNENFGRATVVEILEYFSGIPEQPSPLWKKITTNPKHKFPLKINDTTFVLEKLFGRQDLREIFDALPARAKSKAQPKYVEKQFDQFVALVDMLMSGFLPWMLRALETLSPFGSEHARNADWNSLARVFETDEMADFAEDESSDD